MVSHELYTSTNNRIRRTMGKYVKLRFNLENDRRKISGVEIRIERIYVRDTELGV